MVVEIRTLLSVLLLAAIVTVPGVLAAKVKKILKFDDDFRFGAATAAYQIEGAWNTDGKGESVWDRMCHEHPEYIRDGTNGDIADDSYHKYKEDVEKLVELGVQFYRFSISWPRVLPKGDRSVINRLGIDYYKNLIKELTDNGIEPLVTMYHWDLPQELQELGGWPNPVMADYFEDYARLLFEEYGDTVKNWITFNEPLEFTMGYAGEAYMPPSLNKHGVADYMATHTVLLAHARVYHMYYDEFNPDKEGKVSITLNSDWIQPSTDSEEDKELADRKIQFNLGWFAHPIFSEEGDYPPVMKDRVVANSIAEGLPRSRLPSFTPEEVEYIKGTSDYFGLNHYTTSIAVNEVSGQNPSRDRDSGVSVMQDPTWPGSAAEWLYVVPEGFRHILNWIHKNYKKPIMVTENGYADTGELNDYRRANYYKSYLEQLWYAIHEDNVNVIAYTAWSAIDNFEWIRGYTQRYGVYLVNYTDPNLPRIKKYSADVLSEIFTTKILQIEEDE